MILNEKVFLYTKYQQNRNVCYSQTLRGISSQFDSIQWWNFQNSFLFLNILGSLSQISHRHDTGCCSFSISLLGELVSSRPLGVLPFSPSHLISKTNTKTGGQDGNINEDTEDGNREVRAMVNKLGSRLVTEESKWPGMKTMKGNNNAIINVECRVKLMDCRVGNKT